MVCGEWIGQLHHRDRFEAHLACAKLSWAGAIATVQSSRRLAFIVIP